MSIVSVKRSWVAAYDFACKSKGALSKRMKRMIASAKGRAAGE